MRRILFVPCAQGIFLKEKRKAYTLYLICPYAAGNIDDVRALETEMLSIYRAAHAGSI